MNTSVEREEQLPQAAAIQARIEQLTERRTLHTSTRLLKQARTLSGIFLALLQAVERLRASPAAIEFGCGTAAGVRGRIVVSDETAVVNLTYVSSRASADYLTEFWRRLGNVLQRHKRITHLRNKKIGLQLHLPVSEVEEQLRGLADRAAVEATSLLDSIERQENLALARKRDALPLSAICDSLELRPV